jgi:hypothetical protein
MHSQTEFGNEKHIVFLSFIFLAGIAGESRNPIFSKNRISKIV